MKRKTILISIMVLSTLLIASSIIATSQAWWPQKHKPEYVGYRFEFTHAEDGITTYIDRSNAPDIIMEGGGGTILQANVTIGDEVYYYPDDFDCTYKNHWEFNAMTGKGFLRSESILTFKMPGRPTITEWIVTRVSGFRWYPNATLIAPGDVSFEGEFELSGSKQFNRVEGFGLGKGYFVPPDYNSVYVYRLGFIKGWPC